MNNRLAKVVDWLIVLSGNIAFDAFKNTSWNWIILRHCNIIEFLAGFLDSTSTGFFLEIDFSHILRPNFDPFWLNSHKWPPPVCDRLGLTFWVVAYGRFNCNFIIGSVGKNYYLNCLLHGPLANWLFWLQKVWDQLIVGKILVSLKQYRDKRQRSHKFTIDRRM